MGDDYVVLDVAGLDALIRALVQDGFDTRGPVVREGAIMPGTVRGVDDLPCGWHDDQAPGRYELEHSDDGRYFAWAVGPGSWKSEVFPATQELWQARVEDGRFVTSEPQLPRTPMAVVGARPCELAALHVLDQVLQAGPTADPAYVARRTGTFVVVAECGSPGGTCFCTSMATGPSASHGFDLALSELDDQDGHRFLVRVGTDRGARVLGRVESRPATPSDLAARDEMLLRSSSSMGRHLDTDDLPSLLVRNLEHPRWDDVASRCLSCGNCTSVCPTCFCSDIRDTTDLTGGIRRDQRWASCFDLDHSHLHGAAVRSSTASRYRQWLTHKLSTWWEQFDTSGCVGCGRCITWCPVGIDLTEEAAAIRRYDGVRSPPTGEGATT